MFEITPWPTFTAMTEDGTIYAAETTTNGISVRTTSLRWADRMYAHDVEASISELRQHLHDKFLLDVFGRRGQLSLAYLILKSISEYRMAQMAKY
jgi:hypothetical protein